MSEFSSYESVGIEQAVALSGEFASATSETAAAEPETKTFPRLDGEVTPLVAANAEVIAPCRWMGGAEVTLTTAMHNYYMLMTEENADQVLADIHDFIASQITKTEETEEQTAAEEEQAEGPKEIDKKNEPQKEVIKPKAKQPELQPKKEAPIAKVSETPVRAFRSAKPATVIKAAAKVQPIPIAADSQPKSSVETVPAVKPASTAGQPRAEAAAVIDSVPEPRPEPAPGLAPAVPTLETAAASNFEPEPISEPAQTSSESASSFQSQPIELEAAADFETDKISPLDIDGPVVIDGTIDLIADASEIDEPEPLFETAIHQITDESVDENNLLEQPAGNEFDTGEVYAISDLPETEIAEKNIPPAKEALIIETNNEPSLLEQTTPTDYEQPVRLDPTIEVIETTLVELSETLEVSRPETAEAATQILDKIIEVPAKLDTLGEAEAQAELEELFVELFEQLSIDYTPELIESLARLTLNWQLTAEIENLKNEEEPDKALQDSGTHEIIKKLLACIKSIQKAISHAGAIGKSALRLYSLNLRTA